MPRIDCPACGKKHNSEAKAASCRARKARELARRPSPQRVVAPGGVMMGIRSYITTGARESMREYVARQSRDNALGMTCNDL